MQQQLQLWRIVSSGRCAGCISQRLVVGGSAPFVAAVRSSIASTFPFHQRRLSTSSSQRLLWTAWVMGEGQGRGPPTAQGLQTDRYTALLHKHNHTALQLYHGSTGAIMFRSGPSSTAVGRPEFSSPSAASLVEDVRCEEMDAGHRRVCWLGWDGSTKEGIDGRQDFSEWLCPEVISELEAGSALSRLLIPGSRHEAGYWSLQVPQLLPAEAGERQEAAGKHTLIDSSTVAIISNSGKPRACYSRSMLCMPWATRRCAAACSDPRGQWMQWTRVPAAELPACSYSEVMTLLWRTFYLHCGAVSGWGEDSCGIYKSVMYHHDHGAAYVSSLTHTGPMPHNALISTPHANTLAESRVRIILTATGFIYHAEGAGQAQDAHDAPAGEPHVIEPARMGALIVVSNAERPKRITSRAE